MKNYKSWNAVEWEEYLTSIESNQTEMLLIDPNMTELMSEEKFREGVTNVMGQNYSPKLNGMISVLMDGLSEKQKKVLHHIFWESLTVSEIARMMGLHHSSVQSLRNRGLQSIAKTLISSAKCSQSKVQEDGAA